jgi:hypothetical protein
MTGVRVYDLAKELKISSNEVLDRLKELGKPAKVPSSTIDDEDANAVRRQFAPAPVADHPTAVWLPLLLYLLLPQPGLRCSRRGLWLPLRLLLLPRNLHALWISPVS